MANKRATAIAKTDGAKLTVELVGVGLAVSGDAWVAEEDGAAAEVLVEADAIIMSEVEEEAIIVIVVALA